MSLNMTFFYFEVVPNPPKALNLVKKVGDFNIISGNMRGMRNRGTVENWPQISSKTESPGPVELPGTSLEVAFMGQ